MTVRDEPWNASRIPYILAQIAAIKGNNEVAMEHFREAVDAGWIRTWYTRIDPLMSDLRKDARFMQMLDDIDEKLSRMSVDEVVIVASQVSYREQ